MGYRRRTGQSVEEDPEELFAIDVRRVLQQWLFFRVLAAEHTQARPDRELRRGRATETTPNRALHTPHKLAYTMLSSGILTE